MLATAEYLSWARLLYGQVAFDLATSGLKPLPARDLLAHDGRPAPLPDDPSVFGRYRDAIAKRYGVPSDEVVPTVGASGGLWLILATLLDAGDELVVENPAYEPLHATARALGARVSRFERSARDGFAVDVDAVLRAVGPSTRAVVLANPHNPSSAFASDETLHRLAEALLARNVTLVVDEAYRELALPRTTAYRSRANLCVTSSLTKCFGMGWARAGFALMPRELAARAAEGFANVWGALPSSLAVFGALGLEHADHLLERAASLQAGKRELVAAFAARHAKTLSWAPPFGLLPYTFFSDARGLDLRPSIEAGLASEGVLVAPGSFFGYAPGFRLSFTAPADVVAEGLERLERVLGLSPLSSARRA